tara:strand:- start:1350 stop:1523 length:174 start_codon:yes stop_codon:yes gene_type:complete
MKVKETKIIKMSLKNNLKDEEPGEITKVISEYREKHSSYETTAFINGMIAYNKISRL